MKQDLGSEQMKQDLGSEHMKQDLESEHMEQGLCSEQMKQNLCSEQMKQDLDRRLAYDGDWTNGEREAIAKTDLNDSTMNRKGKNIPNYLSR